MNTLKHKKISPGLSPLVKLVIFSLSCLLLPLCQPAVSTFAARFGDVAVPATKTAPVYTLSLTPKITCEVDITNPDGTPADGIKVSLAGLVSYSNQDGVAVFAGVAAGYYTATLQPPGDKVQTTSVILNSGQPTQSVIYRLVAQHSFASQIIKYGSISLITIVVVAGIVYWEELWHRLVKRYLKPQPTTGAQPPEPGEDQNESDSRSVEPSAVSEPGTYASDDISLAKDEAKQPGENDGTNLQTKP
jgi:hypothetical protein